MEIKNNHDRTATITGKDFDLLEMVGDALNYTRMHVEHAEEMGMNAPFHEERMKRYKQMQYELQLICGIDPAEL